MNLMRRCRLVVIAQPWLVRVVFGHQRSVSVALRVVAAGIRNVDPLSR